MYHLSVLRCRLTFLIYHIEQYEVTESECQLCETVNAKRISSLFIWEG